MDVWLLSIDIIKNISKRETFPYMREKMENYNYMTHFIETAYIWPNKVYM